MKQWKRFWKNTGKKPADKRTRAFRVNIEMPFSSIKSLNAGRSAKTVVSSWVKKLKRKDSPGG